MNIQASQFVLTYWNVRGTTQAVRNLLEYLEVNYQDQTIEWPEHMEYDLKSLVEFPKMPNLKHVDFEVTQLVPIGKYICRINDRYDLLGKTLKDQVAIQFFIVKIFQARRVFLKALGAAEFKSEADFHTTIGQRLNILKEGFLSALSTHLLTHEFYMGYLSIVDFFLYNLLFYFQGFVPDLMDESLDAYMTRFESIEQIRKYFSSGKVRYPVSLSEEVNQKWIGKRNYK